MLTKQMQRLLLMIDASVREGGVTPSFDEMRDALGLKSKSGVHRLIQSLEERGFLRRIPNRARAIEVLRLPSTGHGMPTARPAAANSNDMVEIPVMGRIAAGTPITAIQSPIRSIAMRPSDLGPGEHFALEVRGDSMRDAGILDGDTAVIRRQADAGQGDIVVALIDGDEATLKRYRRSGSMIALEPANPSYVTRLVEPARIAIQGRLVAINRVY